MEENSGIGVSLFGQEMGDCRLRPLEDLSASDVKVRVLLLGSWYGQNCELISLPSARRNVHICVTEREIFICTG